MQDDEYNGWEDVDNALTEMFMDMAAKDGSEKVGASSLIILQKSDIAPILSTGHPR